MKPKLAFSLIALGLAISTRPMPAQTMSFFRQFTTPGFTEATSVAADASGVYVMGSRSTSQGSQASVRKYDSRGNELWTRELGPLVSGNNRSIVAAADGTGLYMFAQGAGFLFVHKYDAGGRELWSRQLELSLGAMAVDTTGVYVVGRDSATRLLLLRKYSAEGAEQWTSRIPVELREIPSYLVADATGVYVVGGVMRKYDPRGNELWTRPLAFHPGGATAAYPTGLLVTENPNLLRRYDADGNELWIRQIAGLSRVATDAEGVYVAGFVPPVLFARWNARKCCNFENADGIRPR